MSTQDNDATISSSGYGGVKAWLYNNYVHDKNAAAAASAHDAPPALLSRTQFDRIHLAPMEAGLALASVPRQLKLQVSLQSESSDEQSAAALQPPTNANNFSNEIPGAEGSIQYARFESSKDDYSIFNPEAGWYTRVRGLSFSSAYEEARLENLELEGYNADVEDNDLTSSEISSVSDEFTAPSTTESSWSDSQDDEAEWFAFRIDGIASHHHEQMSILDDRAAHLSWGKSIGRTPPSKTMAKKIESGPHIRTWTKQMNLTHSRERQVAWTCAAWAFRRADESKECYAVLKGKLAMLHDKQKEAREALVKDIETWRAHDADLEAAR
jgi:hypothetical protein